MSFGKGLSNFIDSVNTSGHDFLKHSRSKDKISTTRLSSESDSLVAHFEATDKRLENFSKSGKALHSYLQRRVKLERDNIQNLLKMARVSLDDSQYKKIDFGGIFNECWSGIRLNLEQETARRIDITDNLEKRVISVLQKVLLGELDFSRRQLSSEGKRIIKDYNLCHQSYQKTNERYRNTTAEWEGLLLSIHTEYGGIWSPSPGVKIWEREINTSKRLEEHKRDYIDHVEAINASTKSLLQDSLEKILKGMNSVAEGMTQILMSSFKHYSDLDLALSSTSLPQVAPSHKNSGKSEPTQGGPFQLIVDKPFEYKRFAFESLLGGVDLKEIPAPIVYRYDEYILCDEATQILSQKVRYQCMDQMSTQEQAEAIQAMMQSQKTPGFLGATAPRKGFNREFIASCLGYLRKCSAINEEGLFRISGNASRITYFFEKSLSDTNSQELHLEMMGEVDMHTVAGAMKRHLRECSILSSAESNELSKCLDYPMTEEKMHELKMAIRALPNEKRDLLVTIIDFCIELVNNEPLNKMNAHAIGISLGLSLFPEMDTSHSTNLLKCMVLYQSQTHPRMKSQYSIEKETTDDPFEDF